MGSIQQIIFMVLSVVALASALGVVLSKNPVTSVLCLIITFFAIAGHYIMMNAQFLAVVHIIVYAGAIMVLFLYVLMLMNLNAELEPQKRNWLKYAGAISGGALLVVLVAALRDASMPALSPEANEIGLIHNLGLALFKQYVVPFEVSSILFLSAMIGAVVIGRKD
ncbi:NADH-quinone oxidoreductase subunit J [Chitinophaga silvatica]|uniref:NADH-quinone oxidoreductase subunit J n=1 Tax=Chitinophaga silvatica TaxID=2282649 RepID=A0A3E1YE16_9BACT|nr:NADH-quinone oxidoreductase subunit J [Chitinophaga silvatica]RFS24517.1 NADH-quinone oxidoreductase subunit J [Chitinophaga silvatica]